MKKYSENTIEEFVYERNLQKRLFTPGPPSLLAENLTGLRPCFGRGDSDYRKVENEVLSELGKISGHNHVVPLQGSASLALEIIIHNFLHGNVLIISSGYYSDRLHEMALSARRLTGHIKQVNNIEWKELDECVKQYDWVVSCSTETSLGLNLPIDSLVKMSKRCGAKLMLDATASIGLQEGHNHADVIGYSSCKGLFGFTGAGFIAFNEVPSQEVPSFYLDLTTHLERRMTGPYHAVCSLLDVLPKHHEFSNAVKINKQIFCEQMKDYLVQDDAHQPLICTYISKKLSAMDDTVVLYESRSNPKGQVVSHLGEVWLGSKAKGDILGYLDRSGI